MFQQAKTYAIHMLLMNRLDFFCGPTFYDPFFILIYGLALEHEHK